MRNSSEKRKLYCFGIGNTQAEYSDSLLWVSLDEFIEFFIWLLFWLLWEFFWFSPLLFRRANNGREWSAKLSPAPTVVRLRERARETERERERWVIFFLLEGERGIAVCFIRVEQRSEPIAFVGFQRDSQSKVRPVSRGDLGSWIESLSLRLIREGGVEWLLFGHKLYSNRVGLVGEIR